MKRLLLTGSLLLATAAFATASDDSNHPDPAATAGLEALARFFAPAHVARGMAPQDVRAQLGAPDALLSPAVWIYWNFKAKDTPRAEKADTLLVIFADNHVQRIRLTEARPVRAFLAQMEARATKDALAAR